MDHLVLYHGSQGWTNPPAVQAPRKGTYEHGPGIYTTTSLERAVKYAKGGGKVLRLAVDPDLRWITTVSIPHVEAQAWLRSQRGMKGKEKILDDLERTGRREGSEYPIERLVNLCVNHEALSGQPGLALASLLAEKGVQAMRVSMSGNEDYVVIVDPAVIRRVERIDGAQIYRSVHDVARIPDQLEAIHKARQACADSGPPDALLCGDESDRASAAHPLRQRG